MYVNLYISSAFIPKLYTEALELEYKELKHSKPENLLNIKLMLLLCRYEEQQNDIYVK